MLGEPNRDIPKVMSDVELPSHEISFITFLR